MRTIRFTPSRMDIMALLRRAWLPLLLPTLLFASYNHPEIDWKSVATEHFTIVYYDRTEPAVYATWKIAEEAYKTLAPLFQYQSREKIAISLAEWDDFSNGYAEWTSGNIQIWLPDIRFDLRGNTTWLRNVITHELAHIISLEQKRRMQTIGVSIGFLVSTPDEAYGFREPLARITAYPSWLAEGAAQLGAEMLGNDCFDSRREMVLRGAVLSNTLLTLDEMAEFNHDSYGNELVYNQGFALTRYIAGGIGGAKLAGLFAEGSKEAVDIGRWFEAKTFRTLTGWYDRWADSLRADVNARFAGLAEKSDAVATHGRYNMRPEIAPDGKYWSWLSSGRDDGNRTDLIVAEYGSSRPRYRVPYAHTAHCFSTTSDRAYFIRSRIPDRDGSFFNDLFSLSLSDGHIERLTADGRIYDVAALPGGADLLCVRYAGGAFGLYRYNLPGRAFVELVPGVLGEPVVNIAAGSSDTLIVFTKIISGRSRLMEWSPAGGAPRTIGPGAGQEESPVIAADGRIYFSADYDGIFNIYSLLPDGSDLRRHTSTAGGHFSPKIGPDGTLVTSCFSGNRFRIVKPVREDAACTVADTGACSFSPPPRPLGTVTIRSNEYQPKFRRGAWGWQLDGQLTKNSSLLTGQFPAPVDSTVVDVFGGFSVQRADALRKRFLMVQYRTGIEGVVRDNGPAANGYSTGGERSGVRGICAPFKPDLTMLPHRGGDGAPEFFRCQSSPFSTIRGRNINNASEGGDTSEAPSLLLAGLPAIAYENRFSSATLGIEMQAVMIYLLLPGIITASPYFDLQITREWNVGGRLELTSKPFNNLPFFGSIPLYLQWAHTGYLNKDISYNYADYTQMLFSAGPRFVPSLLVSSENDSVDTLGAVVSGWMAELTLFHGFPLFKYGALQVLSSTFATYHDDKTLDDRLYAPSATGDDGFLDGTSNCYLSSTNGVQLVFPVNRTINRGSGSYFDALYGHAGYRLVSYVNNSLFDHPPDDWGRMFTDRRYQTESAFFDHVVSAGLEMGRYKSSLFFTTVRLDFGYQVLRRLFSLSLTSGLL